jgi:hypothetical protein
MRGWRALRFAWLLALPLLALGGPASGQDDAPTPAAPEPTPEWEFSVAPYLWMTGVDGSVEADGHSANVAVSFSDIWDALDVGVLGLAEARRDKFSFVTNVIYMKLSTSASRPTGPLLPIAPPGSFDVRLGSKMLIVELRPSYEVLSLPLPLPLLGADDERRIALDLGPGARVYWLDNHLHVQLEPGVPVGPFSRHFDETTTWVDFVGAARVRAQLSENIGLVVSGDYGGFDIGSSSHRTWSLGGFASYRLGDHWDLTAGWRKLSLDRGGVDIDLSGPLIGAMYRF